MRLDLADLIINKLRATDEPQKDVAKRAGLRESFVSRLVHADSNFTALVAAKVLHALGIRPKLVDADEWDRLKGLKSGPTEPEQERVTYVREEADGEFSSSSTDSDARSESRRVRHAPGVSRGGFVFPGTDRFQFDRGGPRDPHGLGRSDDDPNSDQQTRRVSTIHVEAH